MSYWKDLDQILDTKQKDRLLDCFAEKVSASGASQSVEINEEAVTQFYLNARRACWLDVSDGVDCIDDSWLYANKNDYLFFRLLRLTANTNAKIYIQRYAPELSTFNTYRKRQKNSGWIYLMRPGKYVSKFPEDHRLYKEPKIISHQDTYLWGLVGLNVTDGCVQIPTGLRRKGRSYKMSEKNIPPKLKSAYLEVASEMQSNADEGISFEAFTLICGEQLLRFNRTSTRTGLNKELFCNDIKKNFEDYDTEKFDSAFPQGQ